jgi:hypothetical protein
MSIKSGPNIITSGLVFNIDAMQQGWSSRYGSFNGEPTSNLFNSITNTYPKAGNSWGSYHVFVGTGHNLYNGGSFFSIGTISGVTNNEVTTASAHPFLTYDAVRPETTGGGLTANTDYFIKKTGTYTFTVHAFDSTNDGSKGFDGYGFAVHNSVNTDSRVSINASSFPTSWWGYPHLPNSSSVKMAITNGFDYMNRKHDCIRIYYFRSDTTDSNGMAYGVSPTLDASTDYTYSFYHRAANESADGCTVGFTLYVAAGTPYYPISTYFYPTREWQRFTYSFTTGLSGFTYSYWNAYANDASHLNPAVDIAEIQLEQKTHVTHFTPTSRAATSPGGGWNNIVTAQDKWASEIFNDVTYNEADTSLYFGGSSGYVQMEPYSLPEFTVEAWARCDGSQDGYAAVISDVYPSYINYCIRFEDTGPTLDCHGGLYYSGWYETGSVTLVDGQWYQLVVSFDGSNLRFYANLTTGTPYTSIAITPQSSGTGLRIGRRWDTGSYFQGDIAIVRIYDYALSVAEITQNFNALRNRFGI